ncbi:MAG: hypothetical protein MJZ85_10410 [Bacteroidales bacterium]|nr:hypothetical protein [Bacteroidales bacterium]
MITDKIDTVITMVDALVDKRGIDKCVSAVETIKLLNQIRREVAENVEDQVCGRQ